MAEILRGTPEDDGKTIIVSMKSDQSTPFPLANKIHNFSETFELVSVSLLKNLIRIAH